MAQAMLDIMKLRFNCNHCDLCCKSEAGLQNHMQKKHPLDVNSGLTCYTCNKIFSKRDLIENHFKTVKHQLECRRLKKEEKAEIAKIEENTYRKKLYKLDNFTSRPYKPRNWTSTDTLNIPLESKIPLQDPRLINSLKRATTATATTSAKIQKLPKEPQTYTEKANIAHTYQEESHGYKPKTSEDLIVLHITEAEDQLFPEIHTETPPTSEEIQETRTVYLNNAWKVTDEVGHTDFEEECKNIEDIDWLTFISNNINF